MTNSDKKYYKISEVAEAVKETMPTLRFWEEQFPKQLSIRRIKGVRYYTQEDIEKIKDIQYLLRQSDYKIDGAKAKITCENQLISSKRDIAERLRGIRAELVAIRREINASTSFAETVIID